MPSRSERSDGLSFPRDCIIPVATARVPSHGTRTVTPCRIPPELVIFIDSGFVGPDHDFPPTVPLTTFLPQCDCVVIDGARMQAVRTT